MRFTRAKVIVSTGIITLFFSQSTIAQVQEKKEPTKKPSTIAPAEKLPPGWDEVDQRLIFLMVRLANTETSLEAIEKTINKSDSTKTSKAASARRAETRNIVMDRKGGGPVSWNVFYGTTAEKFFYHPVDANSTYHTATVLSQQGPGADNKVGGGVPASQGLPVHQRPPQFDYIYRSNERVKARAEADVAALNGKMSSLIARRQRLEAEQAELWVEIAFRAIDHYDLNKKPLLRYEPLLVSTDPDAIQHVEIVKSNTQFMRVALSIIETAKNNQASAFKTIQTKVTNARTKFDDALLQQGVDVTEKSAPVAKFASLAKRLDDVSKNLSESYEVATEGDEAKDEVRKETFRGMLQQSLVSYAQIILAMDEMCVVMQKDWKIKPDLKKPLAGEYQPTNVSVEDVENRLSADKNPPEFIEALELDGLYPALSNNGLTVFFEKGNTIWTAQRLDSNSNFTDMKPVFRGRHPTVSNDGLEIVYLENKDGDQVPTLHIAKRDSTQQRFRGHMEIQELSQLRISKSPFLSSDGLTLCFRVNGKSQSVLVVERSSRNAKWSTPKLLVASEVEKTAGGSIVWTCLSEDGLTLIASLESLKPEENNLLILNRNDTDKPFSQFSVINDKVIPKSVRCPRFVENTGELFVTGHPKVKPIFNIGIIKNFSLPKSPH